MMLQVAASTRKRKIKSYLNLCNPSEKKMSTKPSLSKFHVQCCIYLPFNASNEEDQVAIDFGAVDKFVNVAGIHCLSCLQAACADAITH